MSGERERIEAGVRALGLPVGEERLERWQRLLEMLARWNRAYNLTAIRDRAQMVTHHLLDSLAIAPWLGDGRVLDVGTGPGFPGLPLAILRPEQPFVLLDSNGKKIRFVRQVVAELGLTNVEPVQARVEGYRPPQPFDAVVSRAFSALAPFVEAACPLAAPGGRLLAMKGRLSEEELVELGDDLRVESLPLRVPGLAAERHLVIIECPSRSAGKRRDTPVA